MKHKARACLLWNVVIPFAGDGDGLHNDECCEVMPVVHFMKLPVKKVNGPHFTSIALIACF